MLCFAPTRSGKGVGLILPTLLSWEHSSVVLGIKGENFALTSGHLKGLDHQVLRFDPSDSEGASAAFNPLAEIRLNSAVVIPDVQRIASMVKAPGVVAGWSRGRSDSLYFSMPLDSQTSQATAVKAVEASPASSTEGDFFDEYQKRLED